MRVDDEHLVALVMAEALAAAIREHDDATAIRQLRSWAGDDAAVLETASRRCQRFDLVDDATARRAVDLLRSASGSAGSDVCPDLSSPG